MGTIGQKLDKLADTKENIRQAIIGKGVEVPSSTIFADYPNKIKAIQVGLPGGVVMKTHRLVDLDITPNPNRWEVGDIVPCYSVVPRQQLSLTEWSPEGGIKATGYFNIKYCVSPNGRYLLRYYSSNKTTRGILTCEVYEWNTEINDYLYKKTVQGDGSNYLEKVEGTVMYAQQKVFWDTYSKTFGIISSEISTGNGRKVLVFNPEDDTIAPITVRQVVEDGQDYFYVVTSQICGDYIVSIYNKSSILWLTSLVYQKISDPSFRVLGSKAPTISGGICPFLSLTSNTTFGGMGSSFEDTPAAWVYNAGLVNQGKNVFLIMRFKLARNSSGWLLEDDSFEIQFWDASFSNCTLWQVWLTRNGKYIAFVIRYGTGTTLDPWDYRLMVLDATNLMSRSSYWVERGTRTGLYTDDTGYRDSQKSEFLVYFDEFANYCIYGEWISTGMLRLWSQRLDAIRGQVMTGNGSSRISEPKLLLTLTNQKNPVPNDGGTYYMAPNYCFDRFGITGVLPLGSLDNTVLPYARAARVNFGSKISLQNPGQGDYPILIANEEKTKGYALI